MTTIISQCFWCKHYHSDDPHFWYFSNVEDPNERGYDALRRLFLIEIAKAFGKMAEKGPTRAKACPEEAERGPCRGLFAARRWLFAA